MDWIIQGWGLDGPSNQGPFGRQYNVNNVRSNPAKEDDIMISINGIDGDQAGLELYVRPNILVESGLQYIASAEIDSSRTDMLYGSFRAGIKQSGVNGTCGAFFWCVAFFLFILPPAFLYLHGRNRVDMCLRILMSTQHILIDFLHIFLYG